LPHADAEDRLRERLIGLGYREIVSIPLVDEAEDALFRLQSVTPARLANPLAADASVLRSTGLVSMAHALAWNLNRGQKDLRLFEIGRAYRLQNGTPEEMRVVTLGASGLARPQGVADSARNYSFADLKGDLDQIGELAGGFDWRDKSSGWQNGSRAGAFATHEEGKREAVLGHAGQLAARIADKFKLRQDVFLAEWSLEPFLIASVEARAARKYHAISRYPAVERDFSLILNDGTTFAALRETITALGIDEIVSIDAVDLFRGKHIPAGKYSLLVRVTFQSHATTLTEAQLKDFSSRIIAALEQKLGAALRST
jgi:phenylalanyl-tRNA synthetase beta chain